MDDNKVNTPLMVRSDEDIRFVEEDFDTVSDNEHSSGIKKDSENVNKQNENVYTEIAPNERPMSLLGVPKLLSISRSFSSDSSECVMPMLVRSSSGKKKHHEYEKLSGASKRSAVERITDGSFFRRRHETHDFKRHDKSDDEEHILEALRHVVRKCTSIDPVKRPGSNDVLDLLSTFNEKS